MVQTLSASELPSAVALLDRVGLVSAVANLARYLRWQPDGAWVEYEHGSLVGMVTLLRFGHVGFVGCMAVDPTIQGRGLGRALLEHAHAEGRRAGVTTFLLEATASGQRLYEKLGYLVDHETWMMTRAQVAPSSPGPLDRDRRDRDAILELDRRATGSDRSGMLGGLLDYHHGGVERAAKLVGYGLVVDGRLGPVIASDPGAGRALVDRLAGACTVAAAPTANEPALAALTGAGFTHMRTLRRMRLGAPVAAHVSWLWALASSGAG